MNTKFQVSSFRFQVSGFKFQLLVLSLFIIAFTGQQVCAQSPGKTRKGEEYIVKANFISHFAKLTEWPPYVFKKNDKSILLCVASDKPHVNKSFNMVLNKIIIKGRNIEVKKYKDYGRNFKIIPFIDDLMKEDEKSGKDNQASCHVIFFASADRRFIQDRLNAVKHKRVLTVGETEDFTRMGGIIRFFSEGKKLRYEVNMPAAARAGLRLRAPLLTSAARVIKKSIYFSLTEQSLEKIKAEKLPKNIPTVLYKLKNQRYKSEKEFVDALRKTIGKDQAVKYKVLIFKHVVRECK
ncbi:MAG: YfiR family protein [Desulfobacterales bacterium]|nr:YfiR family protein [Desulfobacterales bacterium]